MSNSASHIYLHVPFCSGKCSYCSFYSERFSSAVADSYVCAVATELGLRFSELPRAVPETIYFGGGTPSVLDVCQLERLLRLFQEKVSLSGLSEWSVEANPGTLEEEKLSVLCDAGVNRVSFGVQAFDDTVLNILGRRHCVSDISRSFETARSVGISNLGLDLIAGLPGVDEMGWAETLDQALDLDPKHLSVYALTIEQGTDMYARCNAGELLLPDEDFVSEMLGVAVEKLQAAGFDHYEVSNFARPGFECRHNMSYWNGSDYLGFGPAASSRSGLERWTNMPDVSAYIGALSSGDLPPSEVAKHSLVDDVTERMVFSFRTSAGIDLDEFCSVYGETARNLRTGWEKVLSVLNADGLVRREGTRWLPSESGMVQADGIARELLGDEVC